MRDQIDANTRTQQIALGVAQSLTDRRIDIPTIDGERKALDEALNAPVRQADPQQRELLELLGIGGA